MFEMKRRKLPAKTSFIFFLGWLHIKAHKLLKTAILLVQELKSRQKNIFDPTFGVVTLEIYGTFYHNNYGNYDFITDSQCDCYIFYVNESIQFCMISGETLPFKTDFNHTWRHN